MDVKDWLYWPYVKLEMVNRNKYPKIVYEWIASKIDIFGYYGDDVSKLVNAENGSRAISICEPIAHTSGAMTLVEEIDRTEFTDKNGCIIEASETIEGCALDFFAFLCETFKTSDSRKVQACVVAIATFTDYEDVIVIPCPSFKDSRIYCKKYLDGNEEIYLQVYKGMNFDSSIGRVAAS